MKYLLNSEPVEMVLIPSPISLLFFYHYNYKCFLKQRFLLKWLYLTGDIQILFQQDHCLLSFNSQTFLPENATRPKYIVQA